MPTKTYSLSGTLTYILLIFPGTASARIPICLPSLFSLFFARTSLHAFGSNIQFSRTLSSLHRTPIIHSPSYILWCPHSQTHILEVLSLSHCNYLSPPHNNQYCCFFPLFVLVESQLKSSHWPIVDTSDRFFRIFQRLWTLQEVLRLRMCMFQPEP